MSEKKDLKLATGLWIVAVPIGNPLDITLHARNVLENCDLVAAEDTRVYHQLCHDQKLTRKKVLSHYKENEESSAQELCQWILDHHGALALITDAGTPLIQDPGYRITKLCYEKEIPIHLAPGPSSVTTAVSACPFGGEGFLFWGFAPKTKTQRITVFQEIQSFSKKIVFFESPHRLQDHLNDALEVFGDTQVFVARELTKKYQELICAPLSQVLQKFSKQTPLGEFVIIYPSSPKKLESPSINDQNLKSLLVDMINQGLDFKSIQAKLKKSVQLSRKELYDLIESIKQRNSS